MYKGENGIDNLNVILQELFNPPTPNLNEVHIGSLIYRENDKVINLVNNIDQNIFNGDNYGTINQVNNFQNNDEKLFEIILEKLGGGGHITLAGAQVEDMTIEETKQELINRINEYFSEIE